MADDPFIPRVFSADDRLRRFSERTGQVLNSLIRRGQVTRDAAAEVWKIVAGAVTAGSVTNAMLADMATARIKGRITAGTGSPEDLTGTQATTLLDVFTDALKGLAPASGGGTTNFLRADGSWAAPSGGGGGGSSYYTAPVLANFSWVNQSTATATTTGTSGAVWLTKPTQGGANDVTQLVRAVPGSTWTMVWGYRPACGWGAGTYGVVGPTLYDSGSGKVQQVQYGAHHGGAAGAAALTVSNYTNATTFSASAFALTTVNEHRGGNGGYFVKVQNDGTDLRYSYGPDLDVWVEFFTQPVGTFLTPDKVGFGADAFNDLAGAQLFHHSLTSP